MRALRICLLAQASVGRFQTFEHILETFTALSEKPAATPNHRRPKCGPYKRFHSLLMICDSVGRHPKPSRPRPSQFSLLAARMRKPGHRTQATAFGRAARQALRGLEFKILGLGVCSQGLVESIP